MEILLIPLHHSCSINLTIYLDTGMGKHHQIINVTELAKSLGSDCCTAFLGYYIFSGEDCTSAFGKWQAHSPQEAAEESEVQPGVQVG